MQECPCCLQCFSSDEFVVPHCNERQHSACRDCTTQWYQKQNTESCMLCRVGKRPDNLIPILLAFGLGIVSSILIVLIVMLQYWVVLLLKVYTYAMCYFYFKQTPCSMTTKQLMLVFFVGFNITLLFLIIMFLYLSYSAGKFIIYVTYNFLFMVLNIHALHFLCTTYSIQETCEWVLFVDCVNQVVSVFFFGVRVFQSYAAI